MVIVMVIVKMMVIATIILMMMMMMIIIIIITIVIIIIGHYLCLWNPRWRHRLISQLFTISADSRLSLASEPG